jgi:hypothetical protein
LALQHNSTLRNLSVSFNYIGNEGASKLGLALQNNTTLTSLDLYGNNNIGAEMFVSIGNIIVQNCLLFGNQYWSPCLHVGFPKPCHQIIMATLLCNQPTVNYPALPDHVWHFIFSFWKRDNLAK